MPGDVPRREDPLYCSRQPNISEQKGGYNTAALFDHNKYSVEKNKRAHFSNVRLCKRRRKKKKKKEKRKGKKGKKKEKIITLNKIYL